MKVENGPNNYSYVNHYEQSDISFAKGIPSYDAVSEHLKEKLGKVLWEKVEIKRWSYNEPSDGGDRYCNVPSFQVETITVVDDTQSKQIVILYPVVWQDYENCSFLIPEKGKKLNKAVWLCDTMFNDEVHPSELEDKYDYKKQLKLFISEVKENEKNRKLLEKEE